MTRRRFPVPHIHSFRDKVPRMFHLTNVYWVSFDGSFVDRFLLIDVYGERSRGRWPPHFFGVAYDVYGERSRGR